MKKINYVFGLLLIAMIFASCASKDVGQSESVEIPATVEEKVAVFAPLTDIAQLEGLWKGGYGESVPGETVGLPFDINISTDVTIEYPMFFKGVPIISVTEIIDYTSYLEDLSEVLGVDTAATWALMVNQAGEGVEYTTEAPYCLTLSTLIPKEEEANFLSILSISEDGKQIKVMLTPDFDYVLDKQN